MPKGKHANHTRGENHYRWNSGRMISSTGYSKLRVGKDHPLSDPNGYAYEHAMVWVNAGNPRPGRDECLHHINGDKLDNRIENLSLISRTMHAAEHRPMVSDDVVRSIRNRYAAGEYGTAIAESVGLPASRVYRYINGQSRVGAGGPIRCRPTSP